MEVFIIAGLGNPGAEYAHTRHNAGFEVMSLLEKKYGVTLNKKMLKGLVAEVRVGEKKIVLCEPQTFMNNSGECVAQLLRWYHCEEDHLCVIYDDIDLPPGQVRIRKSGGPGTHNGMRSILGCGVGEGFPRIRVGMGDRQPGADLVSWVLGRPSPEEEPVMKEAYALAAEAAAEWAENGIDAAMQKYNRKPPKKENRQENQ